MANEIEFEGTLVTPYDSETIIEAIAHEIGALRDTKDYMSYLVGDIEHLERYQLIQ